MLFNGRDKILYSNLESSTRVSSALLEFGVTRQLDFCDAAALILFTKTSASIFRRHVLQNNNCLYNCVGGIIRS